MESATPRRMTDILKRTYCGRIGYEFMHINDAEQKDWLQRRIEGPDKEIVFTPVGKKAILNKLIEAEGFEKFADVKIAPGRQRLASTAPKPWSRRWNRSSSARGVEPESDRLPRPASAPRTKSSSRILVCRVAGGADCPVDLQRRARRR